MWAQNTLYFSKNTFWVCVYVAIGFFVDIDVTKNAFILFSSSVEAIIIAFLTGFTFTFGTEPYLAATRHQSNKNRKWEKWQVQKLAKEGINRQVAKIPPHNSFTR